MSTPALPRLAIFKFSSCDGCQLSLLDLEDELLALSGAVEIAHFLEASRASKPGPYDLVLVEGSVTTAADVKRIKKVRREAGFLVAIGACAISGGIQALRNFADVDEMAAAVYPRPQQLKVLATSTPLSQHIKVDLELRGCPVDRRQLLEVCLAVLHRRRPVIATHSVCMECKLRENGCVLVDKGIPCMGPVTQAGCGAICPAYGRGCYGCFGPSETFNGASLTARWQHLGDSRLDVVRRLRGVNAWAVPNREEAERHV